MTYGCGILTGYAAFAGAALMDLAPERFSDPFFQGTIYESSSEKAEAMNERPERERRQT